MADKIKIVLGSLMVVILSVAVYVSMGDDVRMRIDNDKSVFYVYDNRWLVSGEQYNKLFNGSKLVYRHAKDINIEYEFDYERNHTTITRATPYYSGALIVDTFEFDGSTSDIEQFPVSHTVEIFNAVGLIYQYEVRRLVYDGETVKDVSSPQSFGMNMKIEFDDGYYYSKIYKYANKDEAKLTVKYRITEDYVKLDMRLFDPISLTYSDNSTNSTYAGQDILHSLYWQNDTGLSGYIFQFCNGTWTGSDCDGGADAELKEYYNANDDTQMYIHSTQWVAQTFNSSVGYDLKTVGTKLYQATNGMINISIYPTNATGHPDTSGSPLISGDFNGSSLGTSPGAWVNLSFDSSYSIAANILYAIVMYVENVASGDGIDWRLDQTGSSYSKGDRHYSTTTGGTWILSAGEDMMFETYSDEGTGWVNDTWTAMTGTGNWSNVTKHVNSTVGAEVAWIVYANDTSDSWNTSSTYSYVTTESADVTSPTVTWSYPADDSFNTSRTFNIGFTPADETALDNCTLRDNRSSSMADTVGNTSALVNGSVNTIAETFTADGHYNISIKCWDTSSNSAETIGRVIKVDSTSPTYSDDSTNSTYVGEDILHSLKWEDNAQLSGYIFSFDNGTGSFSNDSFAALTGITDWSNVTKSVNETISTTIQWIVYANDTSDNWNTSSTYSYTTSLLVSPQYDFPFTNITKITWNSSLDVALNDELTFNLGDAGFTGTLEYVCIERYCNNVSQGNWSLAGTILTYNVQKEFNESQNMSLLLVNGTIDDSNPTLPGTSGAGPYAAGMAAATLIYYYYRRRRR